jgi:hypothetical protein
MECNTVSDLKKCIIDGDYQVHTSVDLYLKVKAATVVKKLQKRVLLQEKEIAG